MIRTDPLGPVHPAEHLREDFLEPIGMSAEAAAAALHVPFQELMPFLDEQAPLTGDLALRLERAFGCSAEYWMGWQKQFELDAARRQESAVFDAIPRVIAAE